MKRFDTLTLAAIGFIAANALHTLDHLRQGLDVTGEVLAGGTLLSVLAVATLVLALRRHPWAAAVAATVGISGAVGILAVHVLPGWGAFSDSYPDIGADALSWIVMLIEAAGAATLAAVALRELRQRRALPTSAAAAR